jgi:hypothetical protein
MRRIEAIGIETAATGGLVGQEVVAYYRHSWEQIAEDVKRDLGSDRNLIVRVELGFEDFPSGPSLARDLVLLACDYLSEARRDEILWRVVDEVPASILGLRRRARIHAAVWEDARLHGRSVDDEMRHRIASAVPFAVSGVPGRPPLPPVVFTDGQQFPSDEVVRESLAKLVWRVTEREFPDPRLRLEPELTGWGQDVIASGCLDEEDAVRALLERAHYSNREHEALRAMARGAEQPADLAAVLRWSPGYARKVFHGIRQKAGRRR